MIFRPIFCRTTGQRVGTCPCLRCNPPQEHHAPDPERLHTTKA